MAITYIEAFTLSREALDVAAARFPGARAAINRAAARLMMRRALLVHIFGRQG